jgi:phytoene synthase
LAHTDDEVKSDFDNALPQGSFSERAAEDLEPELLLNDADASFIRTSDLYLNLDCVDESILKEAYQHCRRITQQGSKTFYLGALLLPYYKRRAMWAVYSFCRYTDDLVDNAPATTTTELTHRLEDWDEQTRLHMAGQVCVKDAPHMLAWSHSVATFQIPPQPPLELIEGCRMDLAKQRYENFEELRLYCYRVASTVGLMAAQIIGYNNSIALDYAIDLGIAMQLTNILRDVGEDAQNGRIYIPLEEIARFGYSQAELLAGVINPSFVELMKFQIARARHYYQQALPGIEYLNEDSRLSIAVAANLYSRILDIIEYNNYDVFQRRAYVPTIQKLHGLFSIWKQRHFRSKRSGQVTSSSLDE